MKLALAQINTTVGDMAGNVDHIVQWSRKAAANGAELVIFPELSITGYPPRDLVEMPRFVERSEEQLERLSAETSDLNLGIICGYVRRVDTNSGKGVANSAAVLRRGKILFQQNKMLLPTYDVFDEGRYFTPAASQEVKSVDGVRIALAICEDAWNDKGFWDRPRYARDPVEELVRAGGEILIIINASPYHIGKRALRRDIVSAAARKYRIPAVYVNQIGGNDSLVFDGSSFAMNAEGQVTACGKSFAEDVVYFDTTTSAGDDHENFADECEATYEALVLGTRDYIRKCGFAQAVIGLSGGIDSSLTAAIAVDAIGSDNVIGVGMPGPYSSSGSISDARTLSERLGIRFVLAPIGPAYEASMDLLRPIFGGAPVDVTEENLQARLRGMVLMALSNKWGALVLTTGNKSELAVGYCTLYGDMCGGLAVISDIPKTNVYLLARVANKRHDNAIPQSVFDKAPSAELRPDQKDSDSLPPYDVLDKILASYVERRQEPKEVATELGLPLELVREIVRKVDHNEYKRQQAAPGLKVTTKAFGIGRRFPIAQRWPSS